MTHYRYERLSAQDAGFLVFESPTAPFHVAATLIFEAGPLTTEDGGIDIEHHVEEIAGASPRMQGLSLGPADLAASRRMKTTRVGGGHPDYAVLADPGADPRAPRPASAQDRAARVRCCTEPAPDRADRHPATAA